jgi:hypothetical protein
MADEIAELTELMECYRNSSKAASSRPIAVAYKRAAHDLEEMIAGLRAASPVAQLPAPRH